MHCWFSAVVILGIGLFISDARAITAYSSTDPSLAGTVIAEVDGGGLYSYSGPPPLPGYLPPLLAVVDEKVVRNSTGALDFYYRFSEFQSAGTSPNWLELQPINPCSLSLGYIADAPGDIAPAEGVTGQLQDSYSFGPYATQYAAFDISSDAGPSTALSTKWLLMRTDATNYVTNPGQILFVDQPIDQYIQYGEAPPVGDRPPSTAIYLPDLAPVVPEPASATLLPLAIIALGVRFRSKAAR